jgi:hypothetical protein
MLLFARLSNHFQHVSKRTTARVRTTVGPKRYVTEDSLGRITDRRKHEGTCNAKPWLWHLFTFFSFIEGAQGWPLLIIPKLARGSNSSWHNKNGYYHCSLNTSLRCECGQHKLRTSQWHSLILHLVFNKTLHTNMHWLHTLHDPTCYQASTHSSFAWHPPY